jgi:hypothetical protein
MRLSVIGDGSARRIADRIGSNPIRRCTIPEMHYFSVLLSFDSGCEQNPGIRLRSEFSPHIRRLYRAPWSAARRRLHCRNGSDHDRHSQEQVKQVFHEFSEHVLASRLGIHFWAGDKREPGV